MKFHHSLAYFDSRPATEQAEIPLVLIHGAGGSFMHWPTELRRLPGQWVMALDLPGHGQSSGGGRSSIQAYAEVVLNWLTGLGVEKAVFAGHSMGGAIVLQLALLAPKVFAGGVLVGSAPRLPVNENLLNKLTQPGQTEAAYDLIVKWSYSSAAEPDLVRLGREAMTKINPLVVHGDLLACQSFDLREQIGRITVPLLMLCGEVDKMVPLWLSEEIRSVGGEVEFVKIPQAGHMLMLEQPEAVVKAIQKYTGKILK